MNARQAVSWIDANQRLMVAEFARLKRLLGDASPPATDDSIRSDSSASDPIEEELAAARVALPDTAAIDRIAEIFGLSAFERDVLLLTAGTEMDASLAALCTQGHAGGRASCAGGLSFGFMLAALDGAHWSALGPAHPLRLWRLVDLDETAGLTSGRVRIDERVLHALAGINQLDTRLVPLLRNHSPPGLIAETHRALARQLAAGLTLGNQASACVALAGDDSDGQCDVAAEVAASLGMALFVLALADVPHNASEQEALATLWQREAALLPAALLIDTHQGDAEPASVERFVRRIGSLVFIAARELAALPYALAGRVDKPRPEEQRALWDQALGSSADDGAAREAVDAVAAQFRLSARTIAMRAGTWEQGTRRTADGRRDPAGWLWTECCELARPRIDELAQRVEAIAGWDDLVLPAAQLAVLRQISAQVRQRSKVYTDWGFGAQGRRGLGISALFFGESGVGKTLACEVLAREQGLDLYRIDLSAVVSKYIGETEKNLRRVFDAAEDSGAILLFDEADALFGKRSEVKDSHDRYANIEVGYLLQRMETYRGLAVLTTNQRAALDPAFLRRLRFVVQFPFPDQVQREAIWRRIFPVAMPRVELDYARLARLQMPGGDIRNVALNAAFLAAEENEAVSMGHLARAAHNEAAKHERPMPDTRTRGWQ